VQSPKFKLQFHILPPKNKEQKEKKKEKKKIIYMSFPRTQPKTKKKSTGLESHLAMHILNR
jgi:hypothetical protein